MNIVCGRRNAVVSGRASMLKVKVFLQKKLKEVLQYISIDNNSKIIKRMNY